MSTLYEELKQRAAQAERALLGYETLCTSVANQVSEYVRIQIGWPEAAFKRLPVDTDSLPPNARRLSGGWLDEDGRYAFVTHIAVSTVWVELNWSVYREGGHWFLRYSPDDAPLVLPVVEPSPEVKLSTPIATIVEWVQVRLTNAVAAKFFQKRWE